MENNQHHSFDEIMLQLRRRQRHQNALARAGQGILVGAVLSVLLVLVMILKGSGWSDSVWLVLMVVPACGLLGVVAGLLQRVDDLKVARALDGAAHAEDRFASALQLRGHRKQARTKLVREDALSSVGRVAVESALPVRMPCELKWASLPACALAILLWFVPNEKTSATEILQPEVTEQQWEALHEEFKAEIENLPDPVDPEEKEDLEQLKKLVSLLEEKPTKKEALAEIAKLQSRLKERLKNNPGSRLSMRKAADAVQSRGSLGKFAKELREGRYDKAAKALKALAQKLQDDPEAMNAADFESAAADFERLARELDSHEMGHACRKCASAASAMNRDRLAEAMRRLAEEIQKNSDQMRQCDGMSRSMDMLDRLKRRLNQCKKSGNCKSGDCSGSGCESCPNFVRSNNKKGGLKAGWGTANSWKNGGLSPQKEQRTPELTPTREQAGKSTAYSVISPDERANSALKYQESFAELVRKAEADLSLESVPVAHREFLRRYFMSIRSVDDAGESGTED